MGIDFGLTNPNLVNSFTQGYNQAQELQNQTNNAQANQAQIYNAIARSQAMLPGQLQEQQGALDQQSIQNQMQQHQEKIQAIAADKAQRAADEEAHVRQLMQGMNLTDDKGQPLSPYDSTMKLAGIYRQAGLDSSNPDMLQHAQDMEYGAKSNQLEQQLGTEKDHGKRIELMQTLCGMGKGEYCKLVHEDSVMQYQLDRSQKALQGKLAAVNERGTENMAVNYGGAVVPKNPSFRGNSSSSGSGATTLPSIQVGNGQTTDNSGASNEPPTINNPNANVNIPGASGTGGGNFPSQTVNQAPYSGFQRYDSNGVPMHLVKGIPQPDDVEMRRIEQEYRSAQNGGTLHDNFINKQMDNVAQIISRIHDLGGKTGLSTGLIGGKLSSIAPGTFGDTELNSLLGQLKSQTFEGAVGDLRAQGPVGALRAKEIPILEKMRLGLDPAKLNGAQLEQSLTKYYSALKQALADDKSHMDTIYGHYKWLKPQGQ